MQHSKFLGILQEVNIDEKDIRLISNLYLQQTAKIRIEKPPVGEVRIIKEIRQ